MRQTARRECNLCHGGDARLLFRASGFDRAEESFDLVECPDCGLVRLEPLPAPDVLARYYAVEYYGSPEAKFAGPLETLLRWAHLRRARALARLVPGVEPRRVLDVGCGRGLFLRAMRQVGFEAFGVELPSFTFPPDHGGIGFVHAPAEALPFADAGFDLVSLVHVLEHTTDPAAVLRGVSRVLKPGGVLALAVPHFGGWQARWFGRHWFHLDLPRHLYHFRLGPLCRLLEEQGIHLIGVQTQSWDQNVYGFVQSCLNVVYGRRMPNGLYHLLKKRAGARPAAGRLAGCLVLGALAVPLALVENLVTPWYGQGATLTLLGRKESRSKNS